MTGGDGLNMLLMAIWIGVSAGALIATLPSFLAGTAMTGLAVRFEVARRLPAWAAAGASVGLGFWFLVNLTMGPFFPLSGPGATDAALLAAFLSSGGAAALVFRGVMKLTGRFCVVDHLGWTTRDIYR